jgi:hypothetical protein
MLLIDAMKQPTMSNIRHLTIHERLAEGKLTFSPQVAPALSLPSALASMFQCNDADTGDPVDGVSRHLVSLTLGGGKDRGRPSTVYDGSSWVDCFTSTLPSMGRLKNLTIFGEHCRMLESQIGLVYKSIQMNGSLTTFQIGRLNPETSVFRTDIDIHDEADAATVPPFFSPLRQRRIDACLERNARVPQLLAVPNLGNDNDNNEEDETVQQLGPTTEPSAFPPLFQASFQAPRTAHTNALIGLLAFTTSVGDPVPE